MATMSDLPCYAASVIDHYGTVTVFPGIKEAVAFVVATGANACRCKDQSPVRAHVIGHAEPIDVDLSPYIVRVPVDVASLRAERDAAVEKSREQYREWYPEGRPPGGRMSGDHMLCESSPEELERMLEAEVERRSWAWNPSL